MEKLLRKTGITISLRCLLILASLVFGSSAWGQTTTTIFSETFDKCSSTGGNDGAWSGDIAKTTLTANNTGWQFANGKAASKCAKLGTGSALGSATTPTLNFTGDATLTFRAGAWNATNEKTTLKLSISNGTLSASTVTLQKGSFTEYTINITDVTAKPTIKFEGYQKSDSRFFLDDVVITQTTSGGGSETKTENSLAFESSEATISQTGSLTLNLTTNSPEEVSFSVSPALPTDASILMDEKVTVTDGKASLTILTENATKGTYTITATQASTDDFTEGNATCVLKVVAPVEPSHEVKAPTYYKKITSTDELAVGGTYLIVCEGSKKGLSVSVATTDYTQGDNNTITNEIAATLGEFELVNTNESYGDAPLYQFAINNKYLHGTTSSTIKMDVTIANETKWTIDFDESGNVNITNYATIVANKTRLLYYNASSTSNYIRNYSQTTITTSSNYLPVQLYQKVTDLAISTLTNGYATFVTDVPYVMPKGACGYAVTVAPQVGVITKTEAYTEGAQVPAQTALLIGGAPGTNYYPAVLKENVTPSYSGANYMEGKRTAAGYTDTQRGEDVYYYKLALNSESKPGFYYGATGGAAFQLTKPTTAYLAVPKSSSPVNGYLIDFEGEETGIDSIAPSNGNADGAVYNLNGIRMTQTLRNLPKGVYIVNGKKVIK